jgi:hypothetical protein
MFKITKRQINKRIADLGLTIQGSRVDGYFYFINADEYQIGEVVMVCYLNQLSLDEWRAKAIYTIEE